LYTFSTRLLLNSVSENLVNNFVFSFNCFCFYLWATGSYREQTRSEEGARGSDGIGADLKLGLY